jgi:prepilin peptidase CpaA
MGILIDFADPASRLVTDESGGKVEGEVIVAIINFLDFLSMSIFAVTPVATDPANSMEPALMIAFVCMMAFSTAALIVDVRDKKLPNKLTVPVFFAGLLFHIVNGYVQSRFSGAGCGLFFAFKGFAVGFGLLFVLWIIGGSGGGDVKFMGALGTWLGAWLTFQVLVVSAVMGGLLTAIILTPRVFQMKRLSPDASNPSSGGNPRFRKKKDAQPAKWSLHTGTGWRIPFGLPAALGTWTVLILYWVDLVRLSWPPFK